TAARAAAGDGRSIAAVPTPTVRSRLSEIDLRHLLGLRGRLEERIFLEAERLRSQVGGKLAARRVIALHRLVVAHALDGDPVLRAGELVHQPVELLVRAQLRV